VCKPEEDSIPLDDQVFEEETESKMAVTVRFGFDYWLTKNWTVWLAYHGSKVFADEKDGYTEDVTDFRHGVRLGIATFLTP
jgi:opacity protein-like surface antigen